MIQFFLNVDGNEPHTVYDIKSFEQLKSTIYGLYAFSHPDISYFDEDGDSVRVTCDLEFTESLSVARNNGFLLILNIKEGAAPVVQPVPVVKAPEPQVVNVPAPQVAEPAAKAPEPEVPAEPKKDQTLKPFLDAACKFFGVTPEVQQTLETVVESVPIESFVKGIEEKVDPKDLATVVENLKAGTESLISKNNIQAGLECVGGFLDEIKNSRIPEDLSGAVQKDILNPLGELAGFLKDALTPVEKTDDPNNIPGASPQRVKDLASIRELGFTDMAKANQLLDQHNNDVNAVIDALIGIN